MNKNELINELLQVLGKSEKGLKLNEISKIMMLKSDSAEYEEMKSVLEEMVAKVLVERKPGRIFTLKEFDNLTNAKGILRFKHDQGLVMCSIKYPQQKGKKVILTDKQLKVVVKRKNLNTALDGDTVLIKLLAEKKGKKIRGEVIDILHRPDRLITGTLETDGEFNFLIPDDDVYYIDFLIPDSKLNAARHGDKVSARFVSWTDQHKSPKAEIVKIIGRANKPQSGFNSVMDEFSLPDSFNSKALTEANETYKVFSGIKKFQYPERVDYRKELVITIDPSDAKDFDDAISLKILENGNYQLGVHIADVSHFVPAGSELDKEAYKRGTSVYLVDRVVPMLPEIISNEICSLQPDKVRFTFSVIMEINRLGTVKDYKISESMIKSSRRFSYDEVMKIIETKRNEELKKNRFEMLILELNKLTSMLRKKRFEKGGVDFDTVEVKFLLDEEKNPVKAIIKQNNPATSLVEECMLLANKTVAEHIYKLSKKLEQKKNLPFLFRVHERPDEDKIKQTFRFLRLLTKEKPPENINSKILNDYLKKFKDKPQKPIVNQMIVRSMPKAEYSADNIGHYGLGFSKYTHFTSPIRRYPDLVVHRLIKEYGNLSEIDIAKMLKKTDAIERIGIHTTEQERMAMEAERASVKYSQAVLASGMAGEIMQGTISGITNFGIFVTMDEIYAEGLVHIRDLDDDYYIFDEQNFRLYGKVHKKIYQFGDRIEVQIIKSNIEKRKINLKLPKKTTRNTIAKKN